VFLTLPPKEMASDSLAAHPLVPRTILWNAARVCRYLLPLGAALLLVASITLDYLRFDPSKKTPYLRGSDPNFYFMWGQGLALKGSIDIEEQVRYLAGGSIGLSNQSYFAKFLEEDNRTPTGMLRNKYAIGTGLLAAPVLFGARVLLSWCGYPAPPSAAIYPLVFILTQALLGLGGLVLTWHLLRRFFSPLLSLVAVAVAAVTSPAWYYISAEPGMSHSAGLACCAVVIWCALRLDGAKGKAFAVRLFLLGLSLGASVLVRQTNIVFALVILPVVVRSFSSWRTLMLGTAAVASGALIGFLPQILSWAVMYGSWLTYSYQGERFELFPVHIWEVLFGERNSLFLWSPAVLLMCAGLIAAALGIKRLQAPAAQLAQGGCMAIVALSWIYGSWQMYWLGASFGMRGFVELTPVFALGLAYLLSLFSKKRLLFALFALMLAGLIFWQNFFMGCYLSHQQKWQGPLEMRKLVLSPARSKCMQAAARHWSLVSRLDERRFPLSTLIK